MTATASRACRIVAQTPLAPPYFRTELEAPEAAARVLPGQFVMVRVPGTTDPLLGRPFSVFATGEGTIALLYNVVGHGTARFASRRAGEELLVLGPLGRGFALDPLPRLALLVAGGIGIAAFGLLARALRGRGVATRLLYGARSAADLVEAEAFAATGVELRVATDDGSAGRKGFVTALLEEELAAREPDAFAVYACGPSPMLRRVREAALARGAACELALEARMGCGFGVCLGCVVPSATVPGSYRLVCRDGPCLPAAEVLP